LACLNDLDRAKEMDPAGDKSAKVQKTRIAAEKGIDGKP
jgi:hypothetical protein